jgi:hypothetical protein
VYFFTVVLDGFLSLIKMSSSMNWVASNIAFFDLALQKTLPSQNASFQWGAMVLLMGFFPLVTSSLKSLKHSSD